MVYLPVILCLAVVVLFFVWERRTRYAFIIRVKQGQATLVRGKVDAVFVTDVQRICQLWNIADGEIRGVRRGANVYIKVRGGIPQSQRQAFQNAWNHPR